MIGQPGSPTPESSTAGTPLPTGTPWPPRAITALGTALGAHVVLLTPQQFVADCDTGFPQRLGLERTDVVGHRISDFVLVPPDVSSVGTTNAQTLLRVGDQEIAVSVTSQVFLEALPSDSDDLSGPDESVMLIRLLSETQDPESVVADFYSRMRDVPARDWPVEVSRNLAAVFGTRWAMIGRANANLTGVDVPALIDGESVSEAFTYELVNSPCELLPSTRFLIVKEGVAQAYPADGFLADNEVVGYLGATFSEPLGGWAGLAVLMHDAPLTLEPYQQAGFRILTERIGSEFARRQSHQLALEANLRLAKATEVDPLTQMLNRRSFQAAVEQQLANAGATGFDDLVLVHVDLDAFGHVNDQHGHAAGDRALAEAGRRITQSLGPDEMAGRIAGDRFSLWLTAIDAESALRRTAALLDALSVPIPVSNGEVLLQASAGLAVAPSNGDYDGLAREANVALASAKNRGGGHSVLYSTALELRNPASLDEALRDDISRGMQTDEFLLHYQPIVDFETMSPVAYESLVRWRHRSQGIISPQRFLPTAERTGQIIPLGYQLFEIAARQAVAWQRAGLSSRGGSVGANLSRRQFHAVDLIDRLKSIMARTGADPHRLVIEVTETTIFDDENQAARILRQMKDLGFRIALDDFGVGQSSLSALHALPIDIVKIDRSFVANLAGNSYSPTHVIVTAMVDLALKLGLSPVAEGIETQDQLDFLVELGCRRGQGYFLGGPQPPGIARFAGQMPSQRRVQGPFRSLQSGYTSGE
ncbi:MAG: bifunctional diguanylate cyclase/phosphodiesterase [Actinomycetia bacterium]|nr:bifunctional diguanylate cyclase/phosphodiesterase [Actinomycetes bacterium]